MSVKTFISFRGEDHFKVWALRNLAEFKNVSFEMDDKSLRDAIDSTNETYIKSIIRPKIKSFEEAIDTSIDALKAQVKKHKEKVQGL